MDGSKKEASQTFTLTITELALQNIDEITGYIAFVKHQPLNAVRVGDKIFDTIFRIGKNPFVFRECPEIPTKNKNYRQAVCLSWLVIYKIDSLEIRVLGIIHSGRKKSKIRKLKN